LIDRLTELSQVQNLVPGTELYLIPGYSY